MLPLLLLALLSSATSEVLAREQHRRAVKRRRLQEEEEEEEEDDEEEEVRLLQCLDEAQRHPSFGRDGKHRLRKDMWQELVDENDDDWRQKFRIKKELFCMVAQALIDAPGMKRGQGVASSRFVSVAEKLGMFLYRMGDRTVADVATTFKRSGAVVCAVTKQVSRAINHCFPGAIKMLRRGTPEWKKMRQDFAVRGFPGACCVIDCTHIQICCDTATRRSGNLDAYNNRKWRTTLSYQITSDLSLKIRHMFGGQSGSVSDKTLFKTSPLFKQRNVVLGQPVAGARPDYYMGDGGYDLRPYMMIPFNANECRTGLPGQQFGKSQFNSRFSGVRCSVERCFGVWKARFPVLLHGLWYRHMDDYKPVIQALAVLHS